MYWWKEHGFAGSKAVTWSTYCVDQVCAPSVERSRTRPLFSLKFPVFGSAVTVKLSQVSNRPAPELNSESLSAPREKLFEPSGGFGSSVAGVNVCPPFVDLATATARPT